MGSNCQCDGSGVVDWGSLGWVDCECRTEAPLGSMDAWQKRQEAKCRTAMRTLASLMYWARLCKWMERGNAFARSVRDGDMPPGLEWSQW